MKKRLLALAAMMLCVVMMLSSCALFTPNLKFKKLIQKDFEPETDPALSSLIKLDVKGNITTDYGYSSDLVVLVDTNATNGLKTTTVYNVATNKAIWTATDSDSQSGNGSVKVEYSVAMNDVYVGEETITLVNIIKETTTTNDGDIDNEYDMTIMTETGAEIVALSDIDQNEIENSFWQTADLLCVDGKVYRISEDGSASVAFDWNDLREKPENLQKAGEYYVACEENAVYIYDESLNMTAAYRAPIYSMEDDDEEGFSMDNFFQAHVLSNGNVLVQYLVRQDAFAKKYTFLMDGEKYNLYSVLVQAKNGKTKDLSLDYLIGYVGVQDDICEMGMSEKIDNLAMAFAIEDQRVNMDETSAKLLSMTNKGRVAGVVKDPVPNAYLAEGFEVVAKNRWEVSTADGRTFLLNEKGEVLGEVSNRSYGNTNEAGFVVNKKVYDWDLNMKIDLTEEDAVSVQMMNNSIIFRNEDAEVKLYINGEIKTLISKDQAKEGKHSFTRLSKGAYMITDRTGTKTKCDIYDDQGTLLATITDVVSMPSVVKTASNGALLLSAQLADSNNVVYYRVG